MGSKMAARYRASIGDVKEDAMMVPGWGSREELLAIALYSG